MSKKDLVEIEEQWLELEKLTLPSGVTIDDVEKLLLIKPIRVQLGIVLPKGTGVIKFDHEKNADIKKFRAAFDKKVADSFGEIVLEDDAKDAKPILEKLNSYIEKAGKAYRLTLRTAIAKEIDAKADDLMTVGMIAFKEIEFHFGVVETPEKNDLLDLTKAFKRVNKTQHFGIAWKGTQCVIGVKLKKEFKPAELKELASLLPEGSRQGASKVAGEFVAFSKTNVDLSFGEKDKTPLDWIVREAFKVQTGHQVRVGFGILQASEDKEPGGNIDDVLKSVKATGKTSEKKISELRQSEDKDVLGKLVQDIRKSLVTLEKVFKSEDTFKNAKKSEVIELKKKFEKMKPKKLSSKDLTECDQFVKLANKIEKP